MAFKRPCCLRCACHSGQQRVQATDILVLQEREELFIYCQGRLAEFAVAHGCHLLQTPDNPISLALTLESFSLSNSAGSPPEESSADMPMTYLGSMLFNRRVSGTRVISRGVRQRVAGIGFEGYGAHCDNYPHTYLTFAAALGTLKSDVDRFLARLEKTIGSFRKQQRNRN